MLKRPTYIGVDKVLSGFDNINPDGAYCFSVWHSLDDIAFQCNVCDAAVQKQMLENYLTSLYEAGNTELMYLKCHPGEVGYITKKTPVLSNTPFQICEFQDVKILAGEDIKSRPAGMSYESFEMIRALKDLPNTIEARINAAVDARLKDLIPDDEEEEPVNEVDKYIGIITGVTQNPQIMAIIGQVLSYLKPSPVVGHQRIGMVEQQQQVINDQPNKEPIQFDEELMNDSLNRLRFHCNLGTDLQLLANIAEQNPAYFSTLLKMLRQ